MLKILIIDHDIPRCEVLKPYLTEKGYEVHTCLTGTDGLNKAVEVSPEVAILNIKLPDIDSFTLLEDLKVENEGIKVIMITDHPDMDATIKVMREGAFDCVSGHDRGELDIAIRRALTILETEKKAEGFLIKSSGDFKAGSIIGTGRRMREIFKTIGIVSQSRTTVLIQGESGTGKELVARIIHKNTSRDQPYVAVNCSAIVDTLLESELFGHEKGSFTGAINRKLGKFELARYGTVFLDEISEMSINLQAKLLRVLQEMEFERVGGKDRIKVNARIIAATNKDTGRLVREGKFRDDLYYRLNVITINIPPLREKREDIPPLVDYLLKKTNSNLNKMIMGVTDEVMDVFMKYSWPGNIRELENLLVRAAVMAGGRILGRADFPNMLNDFTDNQSQGKVWHKISEDDEDFGPCTLDESEERHIRGMINRIGRKKGDICEALGISRPTLERKLDKYGIQVDRLKVEG